MIYYVHIYAGWWLGTFGIFSIQLGVSSSQPIYIYIYIFMGIAGPSTDFFF